VTYRPFLGNNSVQNTFPWKSIPGDQLRYNKGFHVIEHSTKVSVDTTKQQTLSMVTARLYKPPYRKKSVLAIPCGGGVDTSTVALRVVGGDEKRSLEFERVKYGRESLVLGSENDCAGEHQQQL
jgi:hypothetical protein